MLKAKELLLSLTCSYLIVVSYLLYTKGATLNSFYKSSVSFIFLLFAPFISIYRYFPIFFILIFFALFYFSLKKIHHNGFRVLTFILLFLNWFLYGMYCASQYIGA